MVGNRFVSVVLFFMIFFSSFYFLGYSVDAVVVNPGTHFVVGNENYSVSRSMTFDHVTIGATYVTFNTTGFNVSSANTIYVNLSYLHPTPASVANGTRLLTFNATTSAGSVGFNLSGFVGGFSYKARRNNTVFANITANASGNIYFVNSVWSMKNLSIWSSSAAWSNHAPIFSNPSPVNGSVGVSLLHATNVTVSDQDGNSTTVCFWNNKTGAWVKAQQNNSFAANTTARDLSASWASSYSTKYWWKVTAYDGHVNVSAIYYFTTTAPPPPPPWSNHDPVISNPVPANGSTGVLLSPLTSVYIADQDGNSTTVCFWNNKTGAWVKAQQNNTVTANTTVRDMSASWCTAYGTKYWWKVTAYDGHDNISAIYHFTTWSNTPPVLSTPHPGNNSYISGIVTDVDVRVSDADGNTTTVCWWNNKTGAWIKFQQNNLVASGSKVTASASWVSDWNTRYWWMVTVEDDFDNVSAIYCFRTGSEPMNYSGISSNFINWSLQGYTHLLGFLFWPIMFTVIGVYIYLKQQSVIAWAIGMLILIAAFGNGLAGVDPWFNLMYILVSLAFMGLILLFITKVRR